MRRDRTRPRAPPRRGRGAGWQVGILLKAPIPGRVKTRLGAAVGMGPAAMLHGAFSRDVFGELSLLAAARLWIFFAPASGEERCRRLLGRAAGKRPPRFHPQAGGDLGSRLRAAFEAMRAGEGHGWDGLVAEGPGMVLVGTDSPLLQRQAVRRAMELLDGGADLVLGPAADGGYYLIALREPHRALFASIPWSSSRVLEATLGRARRLGLAVRLLPRDRDVDTWKDLCALWIRLRRRRRAGRRTPPHTYLACSRLFSDRGALRSPGRGGKGH